MKENIKRAADTQLGIRVAIVVIYASCVMALYLLIRWDPIALRLMRYVTAATGFSAAAALMQDLKLVPRLDKLLEALILLIPAIAMPLALAVVAPWRVSDLTPNDAFVAWLCAMSTVFYWALAARKIVRARHCR